MKLDPDYVTVFDRLSRQLDKLTLLEQQNIVEGLAVRHILKAAFPDAERLEPVLNTLVDRIVARLERAVEEGERRHRLKQNQANRSRDEP